ncbi:MAG: hypothetical protein ACR2F1_15275 [Nitrososphaeraceae archaeon]
MKLKLEITIAAVAVILGISTINIYAQLDPQPQIIGNKNVEDHIKSLENTSEKCEEKEENIELRVCSSGEGNKITNDPLGLFTDISNKTH